MKKDLRSMLNSAMNSPQGQENARSVEQFINSYSGKSESEIYADLKKSFDEQKAAGNFSIDSLRRFASMAAPMLSAEQRERMTSIINSLE